jgi:cellulose synthase (UDP-forming)
MRLKTRTSKALPKTQTQKLISPWVWAVFVGSVLLFASTVFFVSWSSTGPTLFPVEQSYSSVIRYLPEFLQVPTNEWDFAFPTVSVALLCILLRFIPATNWTRLVIKIVLLTLGVRYLVWRTVATLNFTHWASAALSLFLYAFELLGFLVFCLNALQTVWSNARQRSVEADQYSQDVLSGRYLPSVDVFIPTYNEPEYIVRRTAIGCQAIEYPNKKIYILDDTRRPHIRALAAELGCEYITRPDNTHGKAGNLNNALQQTQGELITIMDADFVPFKNFLTRTVGFFQQHEVALVQTPQDFYNPDHHVRNLGIDHLLHADLAHFFEYSQSNRDVANSVVCCGTSYVVRRSSLEAVAGYYPRCMAEDSPTSTRMLTRGYRLIYLNEVLSMGESTRTYYDFIKQRLRWLQGNYQIFCCGKDIPIWSKMNWVQRSYALSFFLGCFQPIFRSIFLLAPLVSVFLGTSPYLSTLPEFFYYFVPYLLLQIGSLAWASNYCTSFFWNEVYEIILCFPALQRLVSTFRNPFGKPHVTTRKGVKTETKNYNLIYTWPLLVAIALTVVVICLHLVGYQLGVWQTITSPDFSVMFLWLIYNAVLMSIAVLAAIDQPVRRAMDRFPLRTACKLTCSGSPLSADSLPYPSGTPTSYAYTPQIPNGSSFAERDNWTSSRFANALHHTANVPGYPNNSRSYWGYTNDLSESGASITLFADNFVVDNHLTVLEFLEYDFSVEVEVLRSTLQDNYTKVALKFSRVTTQQSRQLVTLLYSNMTWWKRSKKPGSLDVCLTMLSALLKLRPVLSKYDR